MAETKEGKQKELNQKSKIRMENQKYTNKKKFNEQMKKIKMKKKHESS